VKLVKGQATNYQIPPHSLIESAVAFTDGDPRTNPNSYRLRLEVVDVETIRRRHVSSWVNEETAKGAPKAISVSFDSVNGFILDVFPTPDKDYEILVRYAGPIQEI